jgi:hypothetical protein
MSQENKVKSKLVWRKMVQTAEEVRQVTERMDDPSSRLA